MMRKYEEVMKKVEEVKETESENENVDDVHRFETRQT